MTSPKVQMVRVTGVAVARAGVATRRPAPTMPINAAAAAALLNFFLDIYSLLVLV
jgi:hypothetical protein